MFVAVHYFIFLIFADKSFVLIVGSYAVLAGGRGRGGGAGIYKGDLSRDTGFSPERFNLTGRLNKEVSKCEKNHVN